MLRPTQDNTVRAPDRAPAILGRVPDASDSIKTGQRNATRVIYSERLWIPLWWWLVGAAVAALVGYELHLAFRDVPIWVLVLALQPVSILCGLWLSRSRISVTTDPGTGTGGPDGSARSRGALHIAGRAHLPLAAIARTVAVPPSAKRSAMGPQLDPAAFVHHRAWIAPLTLIVLDDPDDPTPYWLVSTRHPNRLLESIGAPIASVRRSGAQNSDRPDGGAAED